MAFTDSDNVYSVASNGSTPDFTSNPFLNKMKRRANAFPTPAGAAKDAGSSTDPNADPSVDPSRVIDQDNPPSSGGREAHSTDPNDPFAGANVMFNRPFALTINGTAADRLGIQEQNQIGRAHV